jgi:Domain of unknown function (DUF397)
VSDVGSGPSAGDLPELGGTRWVKSSGSGPTGGNCVEVAALGDRVAVRDSRHPAGPALVFPAAAWDAFVAAAKNGQSG